jgi:hypothetical protein
MTDDVSRHDRDAMDAGVQVPGIRAVFDARSASRCARPVPCIGRSTGRTRCRGLGRSRHTARGFRRRRPDRGRTAAAGTPCACRRVQIRRGGPCPGRRTGHARRSEPPVVARAEDPAAVAAGSLLFLDMIDDARILQEPADPGGRLRLGGNRREVLLHPCPELTGSQGAVEHEDGRPLHPVVHGSSSFDPRAGRAVEREAPPASQRLTRLISARRYCGSGVLVVSSSPNCRYASAVAASAASLLASYSVNTRARSPFSYR